MLAGETRAQCVEIASLSLSSTAMASAYTSSSEGSVTPSTSVTSSASSHSQLSSDPRAATHDLTPSSNASAPSCSGEPSTHSPAPTKEKKKKKKKKKKTPEAGGTDDAADTTKTERHRVEWNSYKAAVAILEENLVPYQKLNPRTQQKDRSNLKETVADRILGDVELKKAFEREGHPHEDIRRVRV